MACFSKIKCEGTFLEFWFRKGLKGTTNSLRCLSWASDFPNLIQGCICWKCWTNRSNPWKSVNLMDVSIFFQSNNSNPFYKKHCFFYLSKGRKYIKELWKQECPILARNMKTKYEKNSVRLHVPVFGIPSSSVIWVIVILGLSSSDGCK